MLKKTTVMYVKYSLLIWSSCSTPPSPREAGWIQLTVSLQIFCRNPYKSRHSVSEPCWREKGNGGFIGKSGELTLQITNLCIITASSEIHILYYPPAWANYPTNETARGSGLPGWHRGSCTAHSKPSSSWSAMCSVDSRGQQGPAWTVGL